MEVGSVLKTLVKEEITHIQLVKYAGASGDFNPIHTVVPFGEEAGLGGVIAHGMLIMGFIGQAIGEWFSVQDLTNLSVRFQAMTRPGEKISVKGSIVGEKEGCWLCEAEAVNEVGEMKVTSSFEIRK